MHAVGGQGVGLQGARRPVRLGLGQFHAAARRQMQGIELAISRQLPRGVVAHADEPPLPLAGIMAYRQAAEPWVAVRRGGVGASLLQLEQVRRRGGGGVQQQGFARAWRGGGGAVAEGGDAQCVAAAAQRGRDRQAVMIAAVRIDPEGKRAVRRGQRVGRQGVGGLDGRRWRCIDGQGQGRGGLRLRQELISGPVHVVEAQQRFARMQLLQRGIAGDDPVSIVVDPHAGQRRVGAAGVHGCRRVGRGRWTQRDPAGCSAGQVAERMAARRQVQVCIVALQRDGLGEVMGQAGGRAGQGQRRAVRHRDGAIVIPAAGRLEMRAVFHGQCAAGKPAVAGQRRLVGKHGDGAVAGVDGAIEQLSDFQRRFFLQGDLSLVATFVGIRAGDGGAAFRFLRQGTAVVPVDVQQGAAQDDARPVRIDVAQQGGIACQVKCGVGQRQVPEGEMARFPIRLVE
ncbi:Uncharacterised protein [Achromobacter ruhlandii]|nr:Uncharacterised protein [Achromobacter ruhlandii]CUJ72210.1 Uncharacterised protein [Achromobacter ruhlandii]